MKYYAGIGSRTTPESIIRLFEAVGMHLAYQSWTLRSGCAPGADSAFEQGAFDARFSRPQIGRPELYIPWPKFEDRRTSLVTRTEPQLEAYPIAANFHPAWDRCSQGARALHARNVHQVLGYDVTNPVLSSFILCWTPGGSGSGGTGQALRIARHYGVQIIDTGSTEGLTRVEKFLSNS